MKSKTAPTGTSTWKVPRRSEGSPKARISEIIDAAARVFERRGFHGATTQDIADELGIRQASLYYYFRSKEAALHQVCILGVHEYVERAEAIASRNGTAEQKLTALIQNHLEPLGRQPAYIRVFIRERRHLPDDSRHEVGKLARRYEKVFEDVIRAAVKSGELRRGTKPTLAALGILGMCNAGIAWFGRDPKASVERIAAQFASIAIHGLKHP